MEHCSWFPDSLPIFNSQRAFTSLVWAYMGAFFLSFQLRASPINGVSPDNSAQHVDMEERGEERESSLSPLPSPSCCTVLSVLSVGHRSHVSRLQMCRAEHCSFTVCPRINSGKAKPLVAFIGHALRGRGTTLSLWSGGWTGLVVDDEGASVRPPGFGLVCASNSQSQHFTFATSGNL